MSLRCPAMEILSVAITLAYPPYTRSLAPHPSFSVKEHVNFRFDLSKPSVISPPLSFNLGLLQHLFFFFFFFSSSLHTLPKQFLFHHSRSLPHCFTLFKTSLSECGLKDCLHAASTASPHRLSEIKTKTDVASILVGLMSGGQ